MRRELRPSSPKRYHATGESTRRADRQNFAGGRSFDPNLVLWWAHCEGSLDRINGAVTATRDRILDLTPKNGENVSGQGLEDQGPSGLVGFCRVFDLKKIL